MPTHWEQFLREAGRLAASGWQAGFAALVNTVIHWSPHTKSWSWQDEQGAAESWPQAVHSFPAHVAAGSVVSDIEQRGTRVLLQLQHGHWAKRYTTTIIERNMHTDCFQLLSVCRDLLLLPEQPDCQPAGQLLAKLLSVCGHPNIHTST